MLPPSPQSADAELSTASRRRELVHLTGSLLPPRFADLVPGARMPFRPQVTKAQRAGLVLLKAIARAQFSAVDLPSGGGGGGSNSTGGISNGSGSGSSIAVAGGGGGGGGSSGGSGNRDQVDCWIALVVVLARCSVPRQTWRPSLGQSDQSARSLAPSATLHPKFCALASAALAEIYLPEKPTGPPSSSAAAGAASTAAGAGIAPGLRLSAVSEEAVAMPLESSMLL